VDASPASRPTDTEPAAARAASDPPATRVEKTLTELLPPPEKVPLDSDPPIALWNTWPLFLTFLGLIAIEWVVRKRLQLA
jgi:hypothetical protein